MTKPKQISLPDPYLRGMVEAALFATGKPLTVGEIADIVGAEKKRVKVALEEVITRYAEGDGALEVGTEGGYILQVKATFSRVTEALLPMELSPGSLRTLSAIALKGPLLQSDLVELVGRSAYDHVKELLEKDLIRKEPEGRSYILKTSPRFDQYYQIDRRAIRSLYRPEGVDAARSEEEVEAGNPDGI